MSYTGNSESCLKREPYGHSLQVHCWHEKETTSGKSMVCCFCGVTRTVPDRVVQHHGPFVKVIACLLCLLLCGCPMSGGPRPVPVDPNPVEAASTKERVRAAQVRNAHDKAKRIRLMVADMDNGTLKYTEDVKTRWIKEHAEAAETHYLSFQQALEAAAPSTKGVTPQLKNAWLRAAEGLEAVQ